MAKVKTLEEYKSLIDGQNNEGITHARNALAIIAEAPKEMQDDLAKHLVTKLKENFDTNIFRELAQTDKISNGAKKIILQCFYFKEIKDYRNLRIVVVSNGIACTNEKQECQDFFKLVLDVAENIEDKDVEPLFKNLLLKYGEDLFIALLKSFSSEELKELKQKHQKLFIKYPELSGLSFYKKELDNVKIEDGKINAKDALAIIAEAPKEMQDDLAKHLVTKLKELFNDSIFINLLENRKITNNAKKIILSNFYLAKFTEFCIYNESKISSNTAACQSFFKAVLDVAENIEDKNVESFLADCLPEIEKTLKPLIKSFSNNEFVELYTKHLKLFTNCKYLNLLPYYKKELDNVIIENKKVNAKDALKVIAEAPKEMQEDLAHHLVTKLQENFDGKIFKELLLSSIEKNAKKIILESFHFYLSKSDVSGVFTSKAYDTESYVCQDFFKAVLDTAENMTEKDQESFFKSVRINLRNFETRMDHLGSQKAELEKKYSKSYAKLDSMFKNVRKLKNATVKEKVSIIFDMTNNEKELLEGNRCLPKSMQLKEAEVYSFCEEILKKGSATGDKEIRIMAEFTRFFSIKYTFNVDNKKILQDISKIYKKYETHPKINYYLACVVSSYSFTDNVLDPVEVINYLTSAWENQSKKDTITNFKNRLTKTLTGTSSNSKRLQQKKKLLKAVIEMFGQELQTSGSSIIDPIKKLKEVLADVEKNIKLLPVDVEAKNPEINETPKESKEEKIEVKESKQEKAEEQELPIFEQYLPSNTNIDMDPNTNLSVSQMMYSPDTDSYYWYDAQSNIFTPVQQPITAFSSVFVPEYTQIANVPQAPCWAQPLSQQSQVKQPQVQQSMDSRGAPPSYEEVEKLKVQQNMQASVVKKEPHPATQEAEYEPFTAPSTSNLAFLRQLIEGQELSEPSKAYLENAQNQIDALKTVETKKSEKPEVKVEQHAEVLTEKANTISQIKSDERFKSETEGVCGFVHDRDRILKKGEVSFKNGHWYKEVKQESKEPSSGVSETKTQTQEKKKRVAVPS